MGNRLVIIGVGGHGKIIIDIALKNEYTEICFIDDNAKGLCLSFSIIGISADLSGLNDGKIAFVIAVVLNMTRKRIAEIMAFIWYR